MTSNADKRSSLPPGQGHRLSGITEITEPDSLLSDNYSLRTLSAMPYSRTSTPGNRASTPGTPRFSRGEVVYISETPKVIDVRHRQIEHATPKKRSKWFWPVLALAVALGLFMLVGSIMAFWAVGQLHMDKVVKALGGNVTTTSQISMVLQTSTSICSGGDCGSQTLTTILSDSLAAVSPLSSVATSTTEQTSTTATTSISSTEKTTATPESTSTTLVTTMLPTSSTSYSTAKTRTPTQVTTTLPPIANGRVPQVSSTP